MIVLILWFFAACVAVSFVACFFRVAIPLLGLAVTDLCRWPRPVNVEHRGPVNSPAARTGPRQAPGRPGRCRSPAD